MHPASPGCLLHLMRKSLLTLASVAMLSACGGGGTAAPGTATTAGIYRYAGSVQCTAGGTPLAEAQRMLTDAGIVVLAGSCGLDGMSYPAVCGAPDGRIHIFDVPATQAQAASAIGFAPLSELNAATRVDCP
jgi:hypothetical protein